MEKNRMFSKRLIAAVLAFCMIISTMPIVLADGDEAAVAYAVTVCESIVGGSIEVSNTEAAEGDTVTFTVSSEEGYQLTQTGYWTVDEDGSESDVVKITANESGEYSFVMPASDVTVGAVFQPTDGLMLIGKSIYEPTDTTDNSLFVYAALGDNSKYESDRETWVRVELDKRFFDDEYADEELTFVFSVRTHKDSKYYIAGEQEYTLSELKEMGFEYNEDKGRYVLNRLDLIMDGENADKAMSSDRLLYVNMAVKKDSWTDVKGNAAYYDHNTSADAAILTDGTTAAIPTVVLYNLDANTYQGYMFRQFVEGYGIRILDMTNEHINQNLGYFVGWPGFEDKGVSAEEAYSPDVYDFSFVMYVALSDAQVDIMMEALREANITCRQQVFTEKFAAVRTFAEVTARIQEEDVAFKAALRLGLFLGEIQKMIDSTDGTYDKTTDEWKALEEAFGVALAKYTDDEEHEAEYYQEAYAELLAPYLVATGKILLEGQLELVLTDNGDGTYTVTPVLHKNDDAQEYTVEYKWYNASEIADTITVSKEELYKVNLTASGVEGTYGMLYAVLSVPSDPVINVSADEASISVSFGEVDEVMNMPEVIGYVAELYSDGELADKKEASQAGEVIFDNLTAGTSYQLKTYAYNVVGHSTMVEQKVATGYAEGEYGVSVRKDIAGGSVNVSSAIAKEGDTVTVTVDAQEGYTLTQVGYWTVDAEGKEGNIVELTAAEDSTYTFVMPGSSVMVGAAFQDNTYPALVSRLNSNKIVDENNEDWSLYIANDKAYLNVGDTATSVYLNIDKRFLELENAVMTLEVRQYSDGGYILAGKKEYTRAELKEMIASAEETETGYVFESVSIDITKELREGYNSYCVVKFNIPSWVDAKGEAMYRWAYTGTDTIIFAEGVELPDAMVWLYNLDENSYRGALVRSILAELDIGAGTVNSENLGQRIGHLIEWPDYEAVENPYSANVYDVEYMLMANLTEVQLDKLLDAMQDNNIRVNLKSVPTVWTAGKTFEELFEIMAEEDETLKAAIALDKMIYTAEELDEEVYGESEYWEEFTKALADAIVALGTDAEETGEGAALYINAREKLLTAYLKVTGMTELDGELGIICKVNEDGSYELSADFSDKNATFEYSWTIGQNVAGTEEKLTVAAEDVYKVKLAIKGTGCYYGEMTAALTVPVSPKTTVSATTNKVTVTFKKANASINTPEVLGYTAQLYAEDGTLLDTAESATGDKIVFTDLERKTNYIVKTYAYNVVGRSDISEYSIKTKSTSSSGGGSGSSGSGNSASSGTVTSDSAGTVITTNNSGNNITEPVKNDVSANNTKFEDLADYEWAEAAVNTLAEKGIIKGTSERTYSPEENITRADYAILLVRAFGLESDNTENFADVNTADYYAKELAVARNTGIVSGMGNNMYAPADSITREDMMVMIYRALKTLGYELDAGSAEAADIDNVSDYAKEAVHALMVNGLVKGKDGYIDPEANTTRAEVAVLLERVLEVTSKN